MSTGIHPMAIVDPGAELGDGVQIGPFAVIGPRVVLGDGCEVGAGAQIQGPARIGRGNRVFPNACIGFEPQDLKFRGEEVSVEIGDNNQFREFCTVHRGTSKGGGVTRVGSENLFMAYTHVAHDCQVGSRTIFANNATLAGHVEVHDDASISAFSSVHQFCRVGRHAYIGGYSVITMDALPFVKTVGQKPACYGLNSIGLKRKGFGPETLKHLERAVRILVRSGLTLPRALEQLRSELSGDPEVNYLIHFLETSQRGVHRSSPRGGDRGGERGGKSGPSGPGGPVAPEADA